MADQYAPRAEVTVDLDAIRHNVALLAHRASGSAVMAVVKADAYGHGAEPVARAALSAGASWLGACSLAEALALRGAGIDAPILSWLDTVGEDLEPGVAAGIDLAASSLAELDAVVDAARRARRPAAVHLKIDTGLSRNGCSPREWPALVAAAVREQQAGTLRVTAVWSHLACADEPGHASIDLQAKRFDDASEIAVDAGLSPLRHLANSAATLTRPDLHHDLVRVGIAMYGLNPVPLSSILPHNLAGPPKPTAVPAQSSILPHNLAGPPKPTAVPAQSSTLPHNLARPPKPTAVPAQQEDLRPAMSFRSSVVAVKRLPAGESVSYGHTWTAGRNTTVALVPVGYADGVPRGLSGRMQVLLAGRRRSVVGRVCMDQIVVDCGDDPVDRGDLVVLFGSGSSGEPTATEWAETLGTIDYEIVTGMYRPRISRTYEGIR